MARQQFNIVALVLSVLCISGAQASAPVPASKPAEVKPSLKTCSGAYGPPVSTTLAAELFGNKMPSLDVEFDKINTKHDDKLSEDELVEYYRSVLHSSGENATLAINGLNKHLANTDGYKGIRRAEYIEAMSGILNETYTGCSGFCNSVTAKLEKCKFMANTTDEKQIKRQHQAKFLLTSCHLGSPDFEKFGECVIDNDCSKLNHCFNKVRHCFFGRCSMADLAVTTKHMPSNSTDLVAKDDHSIIKARHHKGWWAALAVFLVAVPVLRYALAFPAVISALVASPVKQVLEMTLVITFWSWLAHLALKPHHATVTLRGPAA